MGPTHRAEGLDTLRGVAVLAILILHCFNNTGVLKTQALLPLETATAHFFLGVDMFFVLSGFLIGQALMKERGSPAYFSNYFARRVGRIFPLYYLWLGLFFLTIALGGRSWLGGAFTLLLNGEKDGFPLWSYLLFLQNYASAETGLWGPAWLAVTWSLAIEVHFYIVAAVIIYVTPVRYVGLISAIVIAFAVQAKQSGDPHTIAVMTQTRLDAPFVGVFCAWLWRFGWISDWFTRYERILVPAVIFLIGSHYYVVNRGLIDYPVSVMSVSDFVFGFAVLVFARPVGARASIPVRALRWCGIRCYAIYLFHDTMINLMTGIVFGWPPNVLPPGAGWPAVLPAVLLTFGLAGLSWRYLEKPCIERAAAYANRGPKAVPETAPAA
jgi:peptidoglycan/LPS O-acetylase OafA/YrhL